MSSTSMRPEADEHHPYYAKYIALVPQTTPQPALEAQLDELLPFLRGLTEEQGSLRYAPDKWTVKQVLQHVIDGERVFAYRALRAARGDRTPLAAFDENAYAQQADGAQRTIRSLADELEALRRANVAMFAALSEEELRRRTVANEHEISARALAYIIAGHARHHGILLRERYLNAAS
jgi:uncharacterized damage-inducible protein DinB